LNNVYIPVLILNGENDIPYAYTDQNLADAIAGARLVEIPDADHLSVLYDARFKDEVLKFLIDP
jgi:pimeloyl-ACP methyl ester carboxylesterase